MDNHLYTSQEIDYPSGEEEKDESEAESDEGVAESPLNIRRFFLPRSGVTTKVTCFFKRC